MRLSLAAVAVSLLVGTPARAADLLQPTAKWVVNFDDAQCVATRNYGSQDNPIYLVLKAPPLGSMLQIGLIRRGKGSEARQIEGELSFDQSPPLHLTLLQYGVQKQLQEAVLVNLPQQDLAPMRLATSLHIQARENQRIPGTRLNRGLAGVDVRFALSQMRSLLMTLESCVRDLKDEWNVADPTQTKTKLKESAAGDLQGVIREEDYPAVAMVRDQQGRVTFALLIDESGRIADCTVIATSGVASLDAQSCGIVKERARFRPAVGLDGKPAKSAFLQSISWRIED